MTLFKFRNDAFCLNQNSSNLHLTACYHPFNHDAVNTSHYFTRNYTACHLRSMKQTKALDGVVSRKQRVRVL